MQTPPTPAADIWGEEDNPRRYEAYAREYPAYRETSRDLIAVALPSANTGAADAAVLDLACGTGATTREILAVLGPDGTVTGVDKSAAMLGVAAESITDPRVTWIQAPAEKVDQHVADPVDAVICNSAIWQTDVAATTIAIRAVVKTGGRFAFNVPTAFLADPERPKTQGARGVVTPQANTERPKARGARGVASRDRYPELVREMRAIAERDYGWTPADPRPPKTRPRLTRASIGRTLATAGFDVELVTEIIYQASAESARAWLSIPIFTKDQLAGLPYEVRMRVLDEAYERLGPAQAEPAPWVIFVARAIAGATAR